MTRSNRLSTLVVIFAVVGLVLLFSSFSFADEYPSRPVTIIVPFGAGGGVDINTRALAPFLEKELGEKIIIENRGGGGGITGHTLGAMAKPDGYMLTMVSTGICSGPWLIKDIRFSPESYEYIGQVSFIPNFLVVRADKPWKNLKEFVDHAKANPNKLSIPYMDGWTSSDIADAIFTHLAGIETKVVGGFKSGAADIASVLGGHTDYSFNNTSEVMPHAAAGTIRILAVAAPRRSPFFPDVPTLKELGYDDSVGVFRTLAAPKGTPKPILEKLSKALKAAMENPDLPKDFKKVGLTEDYLGPKDAEAFIMSQYEQFGKQFKSMGIAIK
jgi:tripartite-type tricarboxylate transporter receptor subunit TctC